MEYVQTLPTFSAEHKHLLWRIKSTILAIEPDAEVYLYGSRARGEAKNDSDWDVLVLVNGRVTHERKRYIWYALNDIELATSTNIIATVKNVYDWSHNDVLQATPFHQNVKLDALFL
jgi:uncharacterized protein